MSRTFTALTNLGETLQFRSLVGHEAMSKLYEFRVRMLSETMGIDPNDLLGTPMSVEIDLTNDAGITGTRYLSGVISAFRFAGREGDYYAYEAIVRPWLWLATLRQDFRIFQNKTVPEIIQEVLAPYGGLLDMRLVYKTYQPWVYCVQYNETDFNFVSRLMEKEGIYYYFTHGLNSHTLVLTDAIGGHDYFPAGPTAIPYVPDNRAVGEQDIDHISHWASTQKVTSGKYSTDDYDFTKSRAILSASTADGAGHPNDSWEIYQWPGNYTERSVGQNYTLIGMEEFETRRVTLYGDGNCRNIAPGYFFDLIDYPDPQYNAGYLAESAHYEFTENVMTSDGSAAIGTGLTKRRGEDTATTHRISFTAVPRLTPYRVDQTTPKPRTYGPQTAMVTGPSGEEIWTDKYGRVKVQFEWDRYGKKDENSSCWIRVSQSWAGDNFGTMHMPRIGQEVIVDFINGDPDRPIITGRVYNDQEMPPWSLPGNATQSGIKTRSTPGGIYGDGESFTPGTTNILRFEDRRGQEQVWLHAQKDQLIEVENNETKWVGNSRVKTVDIDEIDNIGMNWTQNVGVNRIENVGVVQNTVVGSVMSEQVGSHKDIVVGGTYSDFTSGARTTTIGGSRATTIGGVNTCGVGGACNCTVGGNQICSVGGNQICDVGGGQSNTVAGPSSTSAGSVIVLAAGAAMMLVGGSMFLKGAALNLLGAVSTPGGWAGIGSDPDDCDCCDDDDCCCEDGCCC